MVGHIEFDIYGRVQPEEKQEAISWLRHSLDICTVEIEKKVDDSIKWGSQIMIAQALGWGEAQSIVDSSHKCFTGLRASETKCTPGEGVLVCFIHDLDYENRSGCPVCTGDYKE